MRFRDRRTFGVDRAWLQGPPERMPYLSFDNFLPPVGDELIIIGHRANFGWSLSEGRVSQIRNDADGGRSVWIQSDAAMNPGNSGGPVLNRYAQIVVVVTQRRDQLGDRYYSGLGFGISAPVASEFVFGRLPDPRLFWLAQRKLNAPSLCQP